MQKLHRDPTINPYRDAFLGVRITERLSDRLTEAAPINKSQFVRDAISRAIEEKLAMGVAK
jgi:hypothetical protein